MYGQEETEKEVAKTLGVERGLQRKVVSVGLQPIGDSFHVNFDQILSRLSNTEGFPKIEWRGEDAAQHFVKQPAIIDNYWFPDDFILMQTSGLYTELLVRAGRRFRRIQEETAQPKNKQHTKKYEDRWRVNGSVLSCPVPPLELDFATGEEKRTSPALVFIIAPLGSSAVNSKPTYDPKQIALASSITDKIASAFTT